MSLYEGVSDLDAHREAIAGADAVIVGSFVPDGIAVAERVQRWARGLTVYYDIDTPVTLAALERDDCAYVSAAVLPGFDLMLSFTAGPTLRRMETRFGVRRALGFYCAVDPERYHPTGAARRWDLGYLGTYSDDRQPAVQRLLIEAARRAPHKRFVVAGPQYPAAIDWPENVERIEHLSPDAHPDFYSACGWTLNITRTDMIRAGWSPSVRLFEAAACGCPIVSDRWNGIEDVLAPDTEIVLASTTEDVLARLDWSEPRRIALAAAGRARILSAHTAAHRAEQLEASIVEESNRRIGRR